MAENLTDEINTDLLHVHALAVLALAGARAAIECRSTPEQVAQLHALLDGGAQLTLAIRQADGVAHLELSVLPADHAALFDSPLLRFDGPAIAALAPPGAVQIIDRAKLN
jgi:hypothetical protein